jgi:Putative restriction endonuclease
MSTVESISEAAMTTTRTKSIATSPTGNGQPVPPLVNGDHLSVEEFERRYSAMAHLNKAELINGVVYMPSPVLHEDHGSPHFDAITWLGNYKVQTLGTDGGDNSTLRLRIGANQPQPDAFLRILPSFGGQSRTVRGYIDGAPELILEISATSAGFDLHEKLATYLANGVREYIVWRVWDSAIDWFVLRNGQYDRLAPDANGVFRSEVFPGLWLDASAMIRRDLAQVLQVLQQGLGSPEHAAFVAQMQSRAPRP